MKKLMNATIIGITILSLSLAGCGKQSANAPVETPKPVVETQTQGQQQMDTIYEEGQKERDKQAAALQKYDDEHPFVPSSSQYTDSNGNNVTSNSSSKSDGFLTTVTTETVITPKK